MTSRVYSIFISMYSFIYRYVCIWGIKTIQNILDQPIIMLEILMWKAACSCGESSLLHFPASAISLSTSTLLTPSSLIRVLASSSHTRPFHLVSPGSRMLKIAMYSRHSWDFLCKSFRDIVSNLWMRSLVIKTTLRMMSV